MIKVFIAASLDGFIADSNGSVDFLYQYPEPEGEDMGYYAFMASIDALLMGRKTFETVLGFGVEWPYTKPVYVWTSVLKTIPAALEGKVQFISGRPQEIVAQMNAAGHHHLYIDGGKTIQSFLQHDMIDEMTITTVPALLGSGISLFGDPGKSMYFSCVDSKRYTHGIVQNKFIRK